MIHKDRIPAALLPLVEERLKGREDEIIFPPPVFDALKGEVVEYNFESDTLINRFPVLPEHLNPYGTMQGGIIAALVDNTIGPLSLMVSPPNFTRQMEMKYSKPISPELGYVYVTAQFVEQKKRLLYFEAVVKSDSGERLASAKSVHWVI